MLASWRVKIAIFNPANLLLFLDVHKLSTDELSMKKLLVSK